MHAGSGLRNKLNLTSSRELIRTGCCYLLCVYCLDICQEEVFHKNPGRYLASTAHKQLICLWVYLVDLCSLIREAVRFVARERYWELPFWRICAHGFILLVTTVLEIVDAGFFWADRMRTWEVAPLLSSPLPQQTVSADFFEEAK